MYLDDGAGGVHTDQASSHSRVVRKDLAMSGLLVNEEKVTLFLGSELKC